MPYMVHTYMYIHHTWYIHVPETMLSVSLLHSHSSEVVGTRKL